LHYKLHVLALCSNEPHLPQLLGAFLRTLPSCSVSNTGSIFSVFSVSCSSTIRFRTDPWPSWTVVDPSCRTYPFRRAHFRFWYWILAQRAATSAIKSAFSCTTVSKPFKSCWNGLSAEEADNLLGCGSLSILAGLNS
jgi:hypothetical protein